MSTRITIAPVTRIEGHLDVHLDVGDSGTVEQAHASGTLFRGFENIMRGRDPRDAIHLTQRVCGVCPVPHARASVEAIEQAFGVTVSRNAQLLRNLVQGATCISDHILHFYHLALLDYMRGPGIPPFTPANSADQRFAPPEEQELAKHYLQALDMRREWQELAGIFAGKVPHVTTFAAGGVTQAPTAARVEAFAGRLDSLIPFIQNVYLADAKRLAEVYPEYLELGGGPPNLLSFGSFPDGSGKQLFAAGKRTGGRGASLSDSDIASIKESVKHSHYEPDDGKRGLGGETTPNLDKRGAYSWIKAPRLGGEVFQVGTLPRMIIGGYYQGGVSAMDRLLACARESAVIASAMKGWLASLKLDSSGYQPVSSMPRAGKGLALTEATRGSLAHWLEYADGKVTGYRIITPTSWNASPRDDRNLPGPIEQALQGLKVADRTQPVEVYRVIHSFDPCLGCAVH
jgi:hydrogenase large subunit